MSNRNKDYTLTDNQSLFVQEAEEQGLNVYYDYSGRGMYGDLCPAVNIDADDLMRIKFTSNVCRDNMGLGYVIYARN
jgi:hypothetical protein